MRTPLPDKVKALIGDQNGVPICSGVYRIYSEILKSHIILCYDNEHLEDARTFLDDPVYSFEELKLMLAKKLSPDNLRYLNEAKKLDSDYEITR